MNIRQSTGEMRGLVNVGTVVADLVFRKEFLSLNDLSFFLVRPRQLKAENYSQHTDVYFLVSLVHCILTLHRFRIFDK